MKQKPRGYYPDGSRRLVGPIRDVFFNMSMQTTLRAAISPEGRGGLTGRYRDEVIAHLEELDGLRQQGKHPDILAFWDFENMRLAKKYGETPRVVMTRVLRWLSGVLDATVTRVEAVEMTRHATTPQVHYASGRRNWLMTLRQMGGVVHRAWPPMTDLADVILLDRIRDTLDKMKQGGPPHIICLLSGDKGFVPLLEAAQSEGVTVVILTGEGSGRYYPGGRDFSVPVQFPRWDDIKMELLDKELDCLRPAEEWTLAQGPQRWRGGTVALVPAPEEELDRRVFHDFVEKEPWAPKPATFDGKWVRAGLRLNDTLTSALRRALVREGKAGRELGPLTPEVQEVVERDLADLSLGLEEDSAAVFWNYEDMKLLPAGPDQQEMLGRIVRWMEGFLGMPVQRVEVSRFVEPWERLGAFGHDWLFHMQKLGMVIHRIWPPRPETTNMALTRSIGVLAATDSAKPRLVCVLSKDLVFDDAMKAAQRAGISAVWIGPEERGLYYPARSDVTVPIDTLSWDTATAELAMAVRDPFLPGASTPDAPLAVFAVQTVPMDKKWGRISELELDPERLRLTPADLERTARIAA